MFTIPAPLRERLGLRQGSELIVIAEDDRLLIYPRRAQQLEAILKRIGAALRDRGITLEELLADSRDLRADVFRREYPGLAKRYGL